MCKQSKETRQTRNKPKDNTKTKGTKAWNPRNPLQNWSVISLSRRVSIHCLARNTRRVIFKLGILSPLSPDPIDCQFLIAKIYVNVTKDLDVQVAVFLRCLFVKTNSRRNKTYQLVLNYQANLQGFYCLALYFFVNDYIYGTLKQSQLKTMQN